MHQGSLIRLYFLGCYLIFLAAASLWSQPAEPGVPFDGPSWRPPDDWEKWAALEFQKKDRDGDRYLGPDEMEGKLRDSLSRWDRNKDDRIDLTEFKDFFLWKLQEKASKDAQKGPAGTFVDGQWRPPADWENWAVFEFQKKDKDSDGYLALDEMEGKLRENLSRWDTNKDERIDLAEFKEFFRGKMQERAAKDAQKDVPPASPTGPAHVVVEEDHSRPYVFRAGKLPKQLPPWFAELDIDGDGQVSLYEWHKGGKSFQEFRTMDRNDDGILVAEEVLRIQALAQKDGHAGSFAGLSAAVKNWSFAKGKWDDKGKGKGKKDKK